MRRTKQADLELLPKITRYLLDQWNSAPLFDSAGNIYGLGHNSGVYVVGLTTAEDSESITLRPGTFRRVLEDELKIDRTTTIIETWLIAPYHTSWCRHELGIESEDGVAVEFPQGSKLDVSWHILTASAMLNECTEVAAEFECSEHTHRSLRNARALLHLIMRMSNPAEISPLPLDVVEELMEVLKEGFVAAQRGLSSDYNRARNLFGQSDSTDG